MLGMGCNLFGKYLTLSDLVDIGTDREFTTTERRAFVRLVRAWANGDCDIRCTVPSGCPYKRRRSDAIEYLGYTDLHDLLLRLCAWPGLGRIRSIPETRGIDALDAHWARRPGHIGN